MAELAMTGEVRAVVLNTWVGRYATEMSASLRFAVLARRLREVGAPEPLVAIAANAAEEELRHAAHCQRYVARYGGAEQSWSRGVVEYAPRSLGAGERLTYEVVAQSCVAETESTSTLLILTQGADTEDLKAVVHELARDEVNHAKLGWGYLAWAGPRQDLAFLGPLVPRMLDSAGSRELFGPPPAGADAPELLAHGVLPISTRRRLFVETLETVILPGLEQHGVQTGAAREWLQRRLSDSGDPRPTVR